MAGAKTRKARTPYAHARDEYEAVEVKDSVTGETKKKMRCKHCPPPDNVFSGHASSTNLNDHLKSAHPSLWIEVKGIPSLFNVVFSPCLFLSLLAKDDAAREAKLASQRAVVGTPAVSALYPPPPLESDDDGRKRKDQVQIIILQVNIDLHMMFVYSPGLKQRQSTWTSVWPCG